MPVVTLTNIVKNSSFENLAASPVNWSGIANAQSTVNYSAKISEAEHYNGTKCVAFPVYTGQLVTQQYNSICGNPIANHIYYGFVYVKGTFSATDNRFEWYYADNATGVMTFVYKRGSFPNWTRLSGRKSCAAPAGYWRVRNFMVNNTALCYTDCCLITDLTAAFGAGSEPGLAWCDANIPWFESTCTMEVSGYRSYENINGVYKKSELQHYNVGGVWRKGKDGYMNINGVWRKGKF